MEKGPHGSEQLAAFLLALYGYARGHAGIAVVLTLASQTNAFARQTGRLVELISTVRGEDVAEDTAPGMAEQAERGIRSVMARDAVTVVPVQAAEISRVLARRLFDRINQQAACETANAYTDPPARRIWRSAIPMNSVCLYKRCDRHHPRCDRGMVTNKDTVLGLAKARQTGRMSVTTYRHHRGTAMRRQQSRLVGSVARMDRLLCPTAPPIQHR
jgi:hypothetical protein